MTRKFIKEKKYVQKPLMQRLSNKDDIKIHPIIPRNFIDIDTFYANLKQRLEDLLNSRARYLYSLSDHLELQNSLINYGLQDFMHKTFGNQATKNQLCQEITTLIIYFEPSITDVHVTLQNNEDTISRILEIRIEALIQTPIERKNAIFESLMDLTKYNFKFK